MPPWRPIGALIGMPRIVDGDVSISVLLASADHACAIAWSGAAGLAQLSTVRLDVPLQKIMKSRQEIDLELVEAAQTGDTRAFDTLMTRYRSRLFRYLSPFLRDAGDTEDVVQECFMQAYLGLSGFRGESAFSTWLFRIGINIAKRNMVRNRRRLPRASEGMYEGAASEQYTEVTTDYDTPEAKMETRQFLDMLDLALDSLPAEQRTSFLLREIEGLSYDEIAERMHCPVGTVRSRIHRARDTIAAALKAS